MSYIVFEKNLFNWKGNWFELILDNFVPKLTVIAETSLISAEMFNKRHCQTIAIFRF